MLDREGRTVMEEKEVEIPMFRPVTVFDVSQTEASPFRSSPPNSTGMCSITRYS